MSENIMKAINRFLTFTILLMGMVMVLSLAASCGVKRAFEEPVVTDTLIYEGSLDGNFKSSRKLMGWFGDVEECMGAEGVEPPQIRVLEGNRVMCPGNDEARFGCHRSGTLWMPKSGLENVWKHEYVHYILWKQTGDGDSEHRHEAFRQCSGLVLLPGEE